ncbi:PIH1 domain-containing protein 1 isoform X3 [Phlebotomus papatasi]|uniref:PIH1 domain-containing protein 1 isoform X3 n=1 Tax=Phlebotomus papatasi TaxID=29031 RepID=UPI002483E321|nr:PIH1 domain-containing protein 1 isoform X3 [Phlebotomus papatasi]
MSNKKSIFLESDSSILEDNLRFVQNDFEEEINTVFSQAGANLPPLSTQQFKIVKPQPGFCIKAHRTENGGKLFVNICQTEDIPAPKDITEEELMKILNSDAPNSYKIPMSIGEPRMTKDKAGNDARVCDIAINSGFFVKVESVRLFRDFLIALVFEAVDVKYGMPCEDNSWVILKNRKSVGTLTTHRIENRDAKLVKDYYEGDQNRESKSLIQEIDAPLVTKGKEAKQISNKKQQEAQYKPNPTKLAVSQANTKKPNYRITLEPREGEVKQLVAEFHMPECVSAKEITLDIGEDRILIEARKRGYLIEGFLDYPLNQDISSAVFDTGRGVSGFLNKLRPNVMLSHTLFTNCILLK